MARRGYSRWYGGNRPSGPDDEFDLQLNNGRLLEHFHEGNLTYRSPGIAEMTPDTFVEVSPELAAERGIESGSLVQLTRGAGECESGRWSPTAYKAGTVHADEFAGKPSQCSDQQPYRPRHAYARLQGDCREAGGARTHTGLAAAPQQSRFGQPTPQRGVEVERKWKRTDYHIPGSGLVR